MTLPPNYKLLDELAEINVAYELEEVTPEQEKRGAELVALADAEPELLEALKYAYGILGRVHDGEAVSNEEVGSALQPCADAIEKATRQ